MKESIKMYPDKNSVSVKGVEWSLWIRRVNTRDNRVMFILKPLTAKYSTSNHDFRYEELKGPIWLNPSELNTFIEVLTELQNSAKTGSRETGFHPYSM